MASEQIEFKRATLKAIEPTEKRAYYRDTKAPGLVLAVTPAGNKSFQLVRKFQGSVARVTLGHFDPEKTDSEEIPRATATAPFDPLAYIGNAPRLNCKMARSLATAVSAAMDRGENPAAKASAERRARASELTLRAAFDLYYRDHLIPNGRRKADATIDTFARLLGNVPPGQKKPRGKERAKTPGAPDWDTRRLSTITPADIRGAMASIKDGGSIYAANMALVLLRAILRKMMAWGLFEGPDPTLGIIKFPETDRARFLKGDEAPAFFAALAKAPEYLRHFVLIALATGARRANILGMRWVDLDFHAGLWTVPGEVSKNGTAMVIPLTSMALEVLKAREGNGSPWVFPAHSASGHMRDPKRAWRALLVDADLEDLRVHDLRRSLGSWAAIQCASLAIIGAALGHKSPDATRIYARLTVDPVRDAMERATAAILAAGQPKGNKE